MCLNFSFGFPDIPPQLELGSLRYSDSNLSLMSTSPMSLTNVLWRCHGNPFMRPSAGISAVGTHWICRMPFATSCRNQWPWISICFSLVLTCGVSAVIKRMICLLSHRMAKFWSISSCLMPLKNLFHQITSLAAWDRASSSALVLDVVTVFCLVKRQSIGLLNSLNRYLFVLYLIVILSANAALFAYSN